MNNRIVILGDSLSMPRPDEGVEYESTYPYLLARGGKKYEVICRSRRANDTKIQNIEQNVLDDILFLKPDILIIHLGIVDCAPRLFSKVEVKILSLIPSRVRQMIIKFFSNRRYFFTRIRQISYVDSYAYSNNLEKLINQEKSTVKQIILIKIKNTNEENEKKSFNFNKKIDVYNEIINSLAARYQATLIDPNRFHGGLLDDGIHINKQMHQYLANQIFEKLSELK